MIYPTSSRTNRATAFLGLVAACLGVAGCGFVNPNFETLWKPDSATYMIEGALTRGFATYPRVGIVLSEGNGTDQGSFKIAGPAGAGVDQRGIYVPSEVLTVGTDGRFKKTLRVASRYGVARLFAWDDINRNGTRDLNERLASSEYEVTKNDIQGWSYNAPNWNLFNFTFTQ